MILQKAEDPVWGEATATFSTCNTWRYGLTRVWDADLPLVTFIMLNPSTADAFRVDPTVRRCLGFARSWGAGSLSVLNIFALRSTDPALLYDHPDPVGPDNDAYIASEVASHPSALMVAAWGNHGELHGRGDVVASTLPDLHCLDRSKDGNPRHPLYLSSDLLPVPYR